MKCTQKNETIHVERFGHFCESTQVVVGFDAFITPVVSFIGDVRMEGVKTTERRSAIRLLYRFFRKLEHILTVLGRTFNVISAIKKYN